jgi:D-sedoheptulose 7-phosphate isomerase
MRQVDAAGLSFIQAHLRESQRVLEETVQQANFAHLLLAIANAITRVLKCGRRLYLAGNGGSAADAQHIAAEFIGRFSYDRPSLAAVALTTDTSVLTALGNDYGYEQVFARQIRALARRNDLFIAISTSGNSSNILRGLEAARELGVTRVGFTGKTGGEMVNLCNHVLQAPTDATPLIQQIHITCAHAICGLVEYQLFPPG